MLYFYIQYFKKTQDWYKKIQHVLSQTVMASYYSVFSKIDEDSSILFFNKLITGIGFDSENDPVYLLRQKLFSIRDEVKSISFSEKYKSALIIKSWNYFRQNKQMKNLRFSDNEEFPKPM